MAVLKKNVYHSLYKSNKDVAIDTAIVDVKGDEWHVLDDAHLVEVNVVFNIYRCLLII